jgi:serine/threonine protein kinase
MAQVLLDIARALEHLHSLNIVHCDVKSSNIFLQHSSGGKGFVCKLADFGLAKLIGEDRMYLTNHSVSGTITNLAPERMLVR